MIRLILLFIVALFVIAGVLAVALYQFFGWTGLMVFPFIILALLWLAKVVVGSLFKRFALGLFGVKAGALKGATMTVHSIKSIPKPPEAGSVADKDEDGGQETATDAVTAEGKTDERVTPQDYVEVDVTITPRNNSSNAVWEPSEFILTRDQVKSLAELEEKEAGTTHSVEIWDGTAFGPDDPGKYPGEQRLKIVFAVKPGTANAWLHYYNQPIGQLRLPVGTIDV
jgi:hypothetical protein